MTLRVVVLDDWERVAGEIVSWEGVEGFASVTLREDHLRDPAGLVEALRDADVVVAMRERTPFRAVVLDQLPRLRLLVTTGGVNASIDLEACARRGVVVCGTRSHQGAAAELTWALILAAARRLDIVFPQMTQGGWPSRPGMALRGRTLGILGLGRVGSQVARVGAALGMDVTAWSPHLTGERAAEAGARLVARDELFAGSDVVTVHMPLSAATENTIGGREMLAIGQRGWLVNTSRSRLVDAGELIAALDDGSLGGAALDVFDDEPLDPRSPLRGHPRVLLTPHIGYVTDSQLELWYSDVVADIVAWHQGVPIRVLHAE